MANNAPVKKFRAGKVEVAIWEQEGKEYNGKKSKFYTVTPKVSYKDGSEWKDGKNFGIADLPKLTRCIQKAYDWAIFKEGEEEEE